MEDAIAEDSGRPPQVDLRIALPKEWSILEKNQIVEVVGAEIAALADSIEPGKSSAEVDKLVKSMLTLVENRTPLLLALYSTSIEVEPEGDTKTSSLIFSVLGQFTWYDAGESFGDLGNPDMITLAAALLGGDGPDFGDGSPIPGDRWLYDPEIVELSGCTTICIRYFDVVEMETADGNGSQPSFFEQRVLHDLYLFEGPNNVNGVGMLELISPSTWAMEPFYELSRAIASTVEVIPRLHEA